jgi:hypothetical protein
LSAAGDDREDAMEYLKDAIELLLEHAYSTGSVFEYLGVPGWGVDDAGQLVPPRARDLAGSEPFLDILDRDHEAREIKARAPRAFLDRNGKCK